MAKKNTLTEAFLNDFVKNADGTYSKQKTDTQPRDKEKKVYDYPVTTKYYLEEGNDGYRTVKLCLFGEPMAKQSVRSTKTGHHFQPQKYVDREKDYKKQIANQLPKDFVMFSKEVMITKIHFLYAPLKKFHKTKGMMERIRNGELIPKLTRPDVGDNLKKLVYDSMSGLVYKDDGIMWAEDNVRKYYSTGGCVVIELKGK